MAYELYPGVDDSFNFPPQVRQAMASSNEVRAAVSNAISDDDAIRDAVAAAVANANVMLASRGILDGPQNADEIQGSEWAGAWSVRYEDVTNGPPTPDGDGTVWLLEVHVGSEQVTLQRWTSPNTRDSWYRVSYLPYSWSPYRNEDWSNGRLNPSDYPTLNDVPEGYWQIWTIEDAATYGLPVNSVGELTMYTYGSVKHATFMAYSSGELRVYFGMVNDGVWDRWTTPHWSHGRVSTTKYTDLDQVPTGYHEIWTKADAETLKLPVPYLGELVVYRYGSVCHMTYASNYQGRMRMYIGSKSAGADPVWRELGGEGSDALELYSASPNTRKSARIAFSLGRSPGTIDGQGFARVMKDLPPFVTEARVVIKNINPREDLPDGPSINLTNVAVGPRASGASNSTAWKNLSSGNTGTDGYYSEWFQVTPEMLSGDFFIGYGWSGTGARLTLGTVYTGATASDALTGTGSRGSEVPLYVSLEVKCLPTDPVVGIFSDSTGSGVGSTAPVYYSVIDIWARNHGVLPMHWSNSGDMAGWWQDVDNVKWRMNGDTIARPDVMFYGMGNNDIFEASNSSFETIRDRTIQAVKLIRKSLCTTIYGLPVLPRNGASADREAVRVQYNNWMKTSGLFAGVFDTASPVLSSPSTINTSYTTDGIHLNATGYGLQADVIPASVII